MSRPGNRFRRNTRLAGHGLIGEGRPCWRKNGCAQCICGALSEPGISQKAALRWITDHKDAVRAVLDGE